jgi:SAM-dependent methyltransferase
MHNHTAQFYDFFGKNTSENQSRFQMIKEYLNEPYVPVIEIGPGTGEMTQFFAEMGCHVYAAEPSSSMYSIFLDRLNQFPKTQNLISPLPCPLSDIKVSLQADLAYATSVFSHLNPQERVDLLKSLHQHLRPQGHFIFNCQQFLPERQASALTQISQKHVGKVLYKYLAKADAPSEKEQKVTFRFEVDFQNQLLNFYEDNFTITMDTPTEIESLLETYGFSVEALFTNFKKAPYQSTSAGFVVVAKRKSIC